MTDCEKMALIDAIIDAYHTTRTTSEAAHHILSKKRVQDAFAALSAMQGDGWRGVESAPKSTQVNVYHPEAGVGGAYLRSEGDSDDGWWWAGEGPGNYHASAILPAPTLWQPLPAPPSTPGDEAPAPDKSCPHGSTGPCSICGDMG